MAFSNDRSEISAPTLSIRVTTTSSFLVSTKASDTISDTVSRRATADCLAASEALMISTRSSSVSTWENSRTGIATESTSFARLKATSWGICGHSLRCSDNASRTWTSTSRAMMRNISSARRRSLSLKPPPPKREAILPIVPALVSGEGSHISFSTSALVRLAFIRVFRGPRVSVPGDGGTTGDGPWDKNRIRREIAAGERRQ